jgi:hypothetical protein
MLSAIGIRKVFVSICFRCTVGALIRSTRARAASIVCALETEARPLVVDHGAGADVLLRGLLPRTSAAMTTLATDCRHMSAITADSLSAFAASNPRFIGSKFVSGALCVRRSATLACNLTLLARIHRRKTALACIRHSRSPYQKLVLRHCAPLREACTKGFTKCAH